MKQILTIEDTRDGWVIGTYKGLNFTAKVYDEGSNHGIDGGRVSKLWMGKKGFNGLVKEHVFNYDRGIDIDHPIGRELAKVLEVAV